MEVTNLKQIIPNSNNNMLTVGQPAEIHGIVESIEKSRVKAIIYPEEKKDKKK